MTIQELQKVSELIGRDADRKIAAGGVMDVAISAQISGHSADPSEIMRPYVEIINGVRCGGFRLRYLGDLPVFANYAMVVNS